MLRKTFIFEKMIFDTCKDVLELFKRDLYSTWEVENFNPDWLNYFTGKEKLETEASEMF